MLGDPHVRFDERGVETGASDELLRHRQTKGAENGYVRPKDHPRHTPTLPQPTTIDFPDAQGAGEFFHYACSA